MQAVSYAWGECNNLIAYGEAWHGDCGQTGNVG